MWHIGMGIETWFYEDPAPNFYKSENQLVPSLSRLAGPVTQTYVMAIKLQTYIDGADILFDYSHSYKLCWWSIPFIEG